MAARDKENKDQVHHAFIQPTAPVEFASPTTTTFSQLSPPWYKDLHTVLMLGFLLCVLFGGGFLLIRLSFTPNVLLVFGIIVGFLALTLAVVVAKSHFAKNI